MWICIAPCHEHTSKTLRHGTRSCERSRAGHIFARHWTPLLSVPLPTPFPLADILQQFRSHFQTRSPLPAHSPNFWPASLRFCSAHKSQQLTKAASYKNSHIFTQLSTVQLSTIPILTVQIMTVQICTVPISTVQISTGNHLVYEILGSTASVWKRGKFSRESIGLYKICQMYTSIGGTKTRVNVPNWYSHVLKGTCWRPVTHAQTWASYSAVYRFLSLSKTSKR